MFKALVVKSVRYQILLVLILLTGGVTAAQTAQLGSTIDRYYDAMLLSGEATTSSQIVSSLTLNDWRVTGDGGPWGQWLQSRDSSNRWLELLNQRGFVSYNSYYPSGGNDFEVWQGAGLNAWSDGGVRASFGPYVDLTLAPRISVAQNLSYPTMPSVHGEYGYFVSTIDWPQRFGDDPHFKLSPGESEIRARYGPFSLGFGNQAMWMGPARFNPIILGNNAGGFPHIDLTMQPVDTAIGSFELSAIWGQLSESDYFDDDPDNDKRFAALLALSYNPRPLPGLTLGVVRFSQSPWQELTPGSILDPFSTRMSSALGDYNKDQRASLVADWRFPSVGFETYVEWARNDYSPNIRYIIRDPGHSQAYTLGFRKLIRTPKRGRVVLFGELTQLIHSRDYYIGLGMGQSGFYHHGINRQGHTHDGQILGAGIGTGADSQTIGVDWFLPHGLIGAQVTRTARNKDYLYGASDAELGDIKRMNVEMRYELRGAYWFSPAFLVEGSISLGHNINWNYEKDNDVNNVRLFAGITYRPRLTAQQ